MFFAGQGLALLLQLFGHFGETDLALVNPQASAVGVLVPDKDQQRSQQTRPHLALHSVGIIAGNNIEPQHAFPLFEDQLDLPARSIQISRSFGRQLGDRSVG